MLNTEKICNRCKSLLHINLFSRQAGGRFGRRGICRACYSSTRQQCVQCCRPKSGRFYYSRYCSTQCQVMSSVSVREDTGCWEWNGYRDRKGYGRIGIKIKGVPRSKGAHRISYEAFNGPFDSSLEILHKCHNPCCVNPAHLEPGTGKENRATILRNGTPLVRSIALAKWRGLA